MTHWHTDTDIKQENDKFEVSFGMKSLVFSIKRTECRSISPLNLILWKRTSAKKCHRQGGQRPFWSLGEHFNFFGGLDNGRGCKGLIN